MACSIGVITSNVGRRTVLALAISAVLLLLASALPAPAHADHEPDHQPVARIEMVIHRIIVHDDADWGEGEFAVTARIWELVGDCGESWWNCDERELARAVKIDFDADDGETVAVNRLLPGPGGFAADPSIGPAIGIPMFAGSRYGFEIHGVEVDEFFDDDAGLLNGILTEENGWGPMGKYVERGLRGRNPLDDGPSFGFCNIVGLPPDTCLPAYFSVEYEIRRASVPDLSPTGIKVLQLPGTTDDTVCMGVVNRELGNAGPFQMALRVNGVIPPGGIADAGKLDAGGFGELCVQTTLPASAQLSATVDESDTVVEYNEANNRLEEPFVSARTVPVRPPGDRPGGATADPGSGASASCAPTDCVPGTSARPLIPVGPMPVLSQATNPDLRVGPVEVRARDGGRCVIRGDRNTVSATIANAGDQDAGQFSVEVTVGGERRGVTSIGSLAAGAERVVDIRDVGVAEGERSLRVAADSGNAVAEQDEANNARNVDVDCTRR